MHTYHTHAKIIKKRTLSKMDKKFGIKIKLPFHKKNNGANDKGFGPGENIQADMKSTFGRTVETQLNSTLRG